MKAENMTHRPYYPAPEPRERRDGGVGDLFLRTDGGAGTTLYVKESGNATTAGWVAK